MQFLVINRRLPHDSVAAWCSLGALATIQIAVDQPTIAALLVDLALSPLLPS